MSENQKNTDQEEIRRLHGENQMLKEQLRSAATMISLGELMSTTTHEFNNILMTILNYAKLGLRHADAKNRENAFDKIITAGNRAAKITTSVLGMAKNRSAGTEPTDLVQLTEDALLLLEREMNKYQISVEKDFEDDIPDVMVNGNQIQQVLVNLMINARQAMKNGGRIILKIKKNPISDTVDLTIRDYGTGIPEDILPRIFDSFFSTKNGPDESGKGGTGLGLSMCREIIERHHGKIRVESTVGKGTAFTIKLPVVAEETGKIKKVALSAGTTETLPKKSVKKIAKSIANE